VCLPLLIFPCTIKSRSSVLAPAHPGGPGKMAVKRFWCGASLANIDYIQCLMSLSSTNTDKAARAKSHQIFKITADFVKISETGQPRWHRKTEH